MLHIWSVAVNITPHSENSQVGIAMPADAINDRLRQVLDGRSPWKWGESVLLSAGTIGRLLKGSLPDPEKLVPAIRIENLSLTWLVDGLGTPFLTVTPQSDSEAASWINSNMEDEEEREILVVYCDEGFMPIIHSLVEVEVPKVGVYHYRAVTALSGGALGPKVLEAINRWSIDGDNLHGSRVASINLPAMGWRLFAHGVLGNYRLFGEDGNSGLYAEARPQFAVDVKPYLSQRANFLQISEPTQTYLEPDRVAVLSMYESLSSDDQRAARRMLEGLVGAKP